MSKTVIIAIAIFCGAVSGFAMSLARDPAPSPVQPARVTLAATLA